MAYTSRARNDDDADTIARASIKFSPSFNEFRLPPPQVCCSSSEVGDDDGEASPFRGGTYRSNACFSPLPSTMMGMTTSTSDCHMRDVKAIMAKSNATRSGRQCPSLPSSSSMSSNASSMRQAEKLQALTIESETDFDSQVDASSTSTDEDHRIFEETKDMLSSPYRQLSSFISHGSCTSEGTRKANLDHDLDDVGKLLDEPTSPSPHGLDDSEGLSEGDCTGGITHSKSIVSDVLCMMCYQPLYDCEEWCPGPDLRASVERMTADSPKSHRHPCDITKTDELDDARSDCSEPRRRQRVRVGNALADDLHSEDYMSMDTEHSVCYQSARSAASIDSLPFDLQRAHTPSSPTPQHSPFLGSTLFAVTPGNESWRKEVPRCKRGSSGRKHWCESLQQPWYDSCEDAHCEPCMEAFFTSSLGAEQVRGGGGSVISAAETSGTDSCETSMDSKSSGKTRDGDTTVAPGPRGAKRNSFAMKLAEVHRAPSSKASSSNGGSRISDERLTATVEDMDGVMTWSGVKTRPGRAQSVASRASPAKRMREVLSRKPPVAGVRAPINNTRKSMILRKRPTTPPSRAAVPLVAPKRTLHGGKKPTPGKRAAKMTTISASIASQRVQTAVAPPLAAVSRISPRKGKSSMMPPKPRTNFGLASVRPSPRRLPLTTIKDGLKTTINLTR